MTTITVDRDQYTADHYELQALRARHLHEQLAVQLIQRRQSMRWVVGGDPAHMSIPQLESALATLTNIAAASAADRAAFLTRTFSQEQSR
jgi:hypothetical protein